MALNWNASKCAEKDFVLSDEPDGYRITEAIIFSLMDVGMRGLADEADVEEFLRRTGEIAVARGGTMLQHVVDGVIVDRAYTSEEVRRRIGLTTNVGPMTKRQFTAKVTQVLKQTAADRR